SGARGCAQIDVQLARCALREVARDMQRTGRSPGCDDASVADIAVDLSIASKGAKNPHGYAACRSYRAAIANGERASARCKAAHENQTAAIPCRVGPFDRHFSHRPHLPSEDGIPAGEMAAGGDVDRAVTKIADRQAASIRPLR